MPRRFAVAGLVAALAAVVGPIHADTVLQGAVRQIPISEVPAFGPVGCRLYQVSNPLTVINGNTPACTNLRCVRTFSTNALFGGPGFGGFNCNQESTGVYAPPPTEPSNQTYYNLIDAEVNPGTCNHIAFYAVQGQSANNLTTDNAGDARAAGCAGTVAQNCFTAADSSNADPTPLTGTEATYGSVPHQIRSTGGFSPVPTVRSSAPGGGGCQVDQIRLTWDDPIDATPTMKNGVPSPVEGVNLYMNSAFCGTCPSGDDPGWTLIGQFGTTAGAVGTCVTLQWPDPHVRFALTVRFKGPGDGPTTIETGRVNGTGFVGANSRCCCPVTPARIISFAARYAGRATVSVSWTSGAEGGVQGYYVTRATSPSGPFTRVSDLLSATGDGSRYVFADHVRTSLGRLLYYQVEIANNDGTIERTGMTSVTVPGPKMKRLGSEP